MAGRAPGRSESSHYRCLLALTSVDFVVDLPPGEYYLFCPISGEAGSHEANGLVGTLVIEAAP